jgi:hypothetical protein
MASRSLDWSGTPTIVGVLLKPASRSEHMLENGRGRKLDVCTARGAFPTVARAYGLVYGQNVLGDDQPGLG